MKIIFSKLFCLITLLLLTTFVFSKDTKETEKKEDKKEDKKEKKPVFPPEAKIALLDYGTICPPADPEHPYEVDEKITRIDFHTNSIVLDISPYKEVSNYTVSAKCSPYFYVKYTEGYRFAITSLDFKGTLHIDEGIRAVVKSGNTDALTHVFEGPLIETFDTSDVMDWSGWNKPLHGSMSEGKLWFGCGTSMIRISVNVEAILNNRYNKKGSGSLVLKDFSANIEWSKCPPKKKVYVPTDEEMIKASIPQPPKRPNEKLKESANKKETPKVKKIPEKYLKKE